MKLKVIASLLVGLSVSGCALQKDYIALQGRITTLEAELNQSRALSQGVDEKVTTNSARLGNRLDEIEESLRTVRGSVDESLHSTTQASKHSTNIEQSLGELRSAIEGLSQKIARLESYTGYEATDNRTAAAPATPTTPAAASPAAAATTPSSKPVPPDAKPSTQSLYMEAKKAFDAGDLETAKSGFSAVVTKFPSSDSADNAQFWIGEIYYREKWYQKAILEYQKVIENYPLGNKVPAAYLKQGLSFEALGEKGNARLIFGELVRKHPGTAEAAIAKKKLGK